ncbi:MAG: DUF4097 family beta strand repeat-containing protein [Acidobacteriota bacterium]|nr:DUF4097 family beta strand repeat-containing protein [Acidobacteriota bacterium]
MISHTLRVPLYLSMVLVLLPSPWALASTRVDRTVPAGPSVYVSVELVSGSLDVKVWDRNAIRVVGTLGDDVRGLEIDEGGGEVGISLDLPRGRGSRQVAADLELYVPRAASLEIETVSADVAVAGTTGDLEAETVSGNIRVTSPPSSMEISAVSGDVIIEGEALLSRLDVEVVSGEVVVTAPPAPAARIDIEAVSGNVRLALPVSVSARFDLETFSGSIRNDFGPQGAGAAGVLPAKELEFTMGEGSARVSVEVFSGRIHLARRE